VKNKEIEYYLGLDYDIIVSRREDEGDVSYKAYTRELDHLVFYGVGETKVEALESFDRIKNELFPVYLAEGRSIPEPKREVETLPSGRFLLRIDPRIHSRLADIAKMANKSLNSYVDQVLVAHVTKQDMFLEFERWLAKKFSSKSPVYNLCKVEATIYEGRSLDYAGGYSSEDLRKSA